MSRTTATLLVCACLVGCRSDNKPIAPPDSYVLLVPAEAAASPASLPKTKKADLEGAAVQPVPRLLETGFASEMLRTTYLAGQYIRDGVVDGKTFSDVARANASLPLAIVVGSDRPSFGRGLTVKGALGSYKDWPSLPWIGIAAEPSRDKALIQTLTARFAGYAATLVATAGLLDEAPTPPPAVLIDGYRMAMEVVAREWRHSAGPAGVIQFDEGTNEQRALFADIRENRHVSDDARTTLRSPQEMLSSAGVAATIMYRLAQSHGVGARVAPEAFYAPYAKNRMPPGVSPAAILGTFRNFQAKLLGVWAAAALRGTPPADITELVDVYAAAFPAEKAEAIRIAVVTTFGATVKPGGTSMRPEDARRTLAELTALAAEVAVGRRTLRDALKQPRE